MAEDSKKDVLTEIEEMEPEEELAEELDDLIKIASHIYYRMDKLGRSQKQWIRWMNRVLDKNKPIIKRGELERFLDSRLYEGIREICEDFFEGYDPKVKEAAEEISGPITDYEKFIEEGLGESYSEEEFGNNILYLTVFLKTFYKQKIKIKKKDREDTVMEKRILAYLEKFLKYMEKAFYKGYNLPDDLKDIEVDVRESYFKISTRGFTGAREIDLPTTLGGGGLFKTDPEEIGYYKGKEGRIINRKGTWKKRLRNNRASITKEIRSFLMFYIALRESLKIVLSEGFKKLGKRALDLLEEDLIKKEREELKEMKEKIETLKGKVGNIIEFQGGYIRDDPRRWFKIEKQLFNRCFFDKGDAAPYPFEESKKDFSYIMEKEIAIERGLPYASYNETLFEEIRKDIKILLGKVIFVCRPFSRVSIEFLKDTESLESFVGDYLSYCQKEKVPEKFFEDLTPKEKFDYILYLEKEEEGEKFEHVQKNLLGKLVNGILGGVEVEGEG